MAKAKNKNITIEDALVPVDEQPYEVPVNWCWVKPLSIIEIEYGKGLPTKNLTEEGYPVFGANGQIGYYSEYMLEKPMALMSCRGAYSGTMNLSLPYSFVTSNSLVMKDKGAYISEKFIYYMFSALNTDSLVSGSAQPQVTVQAFNDFAVPLPPLLEQQRIVEQIESLFSKLDEAKEKVESVVDQYRDRRAALIHKAYIGELTSKWRDEKGVNKSGWEIKQIKDIAKSLKYGTAKKSEEEGRVIVIRMGNLQEGEITWDSLVYSNDDDDIQKYNLVKGDVLFNRTNSPEWVGKTSIYRGEYPAIYAGYLIKIDYDRNVIDGEYLNYMLNSAEAREYCNRVKTDGVNQSNINAQKLGAFVIPVPTIDEQREISRILNSLLENEKRVMSLTESVIIQIDSLRKSILAKAFRGELGTNIPNEECPLELLENIVGIH